MNEPNYAETGWEKEIRIAMIDWYEACKSWECYEMSEDKGSMERRYDEVIKGIAAEIEKKEKLTLSRVREAIEKMKIPISKNWDNQSKSERKEFYAGGERTRADALEIITNLEHPN